MTAPEKRLDFLAADATTNGSFARSSSIENYYEVPVDLLQADSTFLVTIRYRDGSTSSVTVISANLGQAEASYPLV